MQGASTFAILVLFMCAQARVDCIGITQNCVLNKDRVQDGTGPDNQDVIPMNEGSDLRIYIPGVDNVIGSSLLFCDDQIDEVHIELAEDLQSYLVNRPTNSTHDSLYWLKLVVNPLPTKKAYRQRTQQLKRTRRY